MDRRKMKMRQVVRVALAIGIIAFPLTAVYFAIAVGDIQTALLFGGVIACTAALVAFGPLLITFYDASLDK